MKLNQVLAVEKGTKSRVLSAVTEIYKQIQKKDLFEGINRTYQKVEDSAEDKPAETKHVQFTVNDVSSQVAKAMSDLMTVTARKDWANQSAKADVVVDGKVLIKDTPVTYLLFLDKMLGDLRTFVSNLPVLDSSESWEKDDTNGLYKASSNKTQSTKKVQKPIVLYAATPEHPAQTQMITEDVIVGYWNNQKISGAIPKSKRTAILDRVQALIDAVKVAREKANMAEVPAMPFSADDVFGYVFEEKGVSRAS